MADTFNLTDNTSYSNANNSAPSVPDGIIEWSHSAGLLNRPIAELKKKGSLLLFPSVPEKEQRYEDNSCLLRGNTNEANWLKTSNLVGFVEKDGKELSVHSRFASDDQKDYFLHHMLQKVFAPYVMDLDFSYRDKEAYLDLLRLVFPTMLVQAVSKGILRTYVRREYNDSRMRGTIDAARHIRLNIPLEYRIAYSTREYDADNPVTELIRHTIETMNSGPMKFQSLLEKDRNTKEAVNLIRRSTPCYSPGERQRVIDVNLRSPTRHAYYTEYRLLQELCIQILTHKMVSYHGSSEKKMHGILFDAAWLWEQYLNTLIGDDFFHPRNDTGFGVQYLFDDKEDGSIFPDFISKENLGQRVIADAKYKWGWKREEGAEVAKNQDSRSKDYQQLLAYMLRFDSDCGLLLFPCPSSSSKGYREKRLALLCGAEMDGEKATVRKDKNLIEVVKLGLVVPNAGGTDAKEFSQAMKNNEEAFCKRVRECLG